jgi:hypothetical protein
VGTEKLAKQIETMDKKSNDKSVHYGLHTPLTIKF